MYLYRISYQWYIVLGLVITLVVGIVISWLASAIGYASEDDPNPDLFIPPVAKYLKKRRRDLSDVSYTIFD